MVSTDVNPLDTRRLWRVILPLYRWQALFDATSRVAKSALEAAEVLFNQKPECECGCIATARGMERDARLMLDFIEDIRVELECESSSKIFHPADSSYRKQLKAEAEERKRLAC